MGRYGPSDPDNPGSPSYSGPPITPGRGPADPENPGRRPTTGPPRTGQLPTSSPAAEWWMANHWRFQQQQREMVADPQFGTLYRNLLYGMNELGWDETRQYKFLEDHGMYPWMASRLGYGPGGGGGGRGFGGGGGGGGGSGLTREQEEATVRAKLTNMAGEFGLTLSEDEYRLITTAVLDAGWQEDQVVDVLLNKVSTSTWEGVGPGTLTAHVDNIKTLAEQYLIPISDVTAREYSKKLASGEMDENALRGMFVDQARQQYGWMTDALNAGTTARDFLAPMRDRFAEVLGLNPADVSMTDPAFMKVVSVTDPEAKTTRAATLDEVARAARRDTRFADTSDAANMASAMGVAIRELFEGRR